MIKPSMSSFVHESAIVAPGAQIGESCHIGPFCTIGKDVVLGSGVRLASHVVVDGHTSIGDDTQVFPFASLGLAPQDLKYLGEPTLTEIGERNTIRECVTIHRGTVGGGGLTRIGNDNLLMAQTHIAHDCLVGNNVIMANSAALAGHVEIADNVTMGGLSGVHQFCRVGTGALVGAFSIAVKDVIPYSTVQGNHAKCYGLNRVGVKRRGFSKGAVKALNHAFHLLLSAKLNTTQALERIHAEINDCAEVDHLTSFIESSKRGVVK